MSRPALSPDTLKSAVASLPDNALSPLRQAALAHFETSGFPATRAENWKYTNLAPLIEISEQWLAAGAAREEVLSIADSPIEAIDAHWLVIGNGRIDSLRMQTFDAEGAQVSTLGKSGASAKFEWPLVDFNLALLEDGLRIRVDGVIDRPLGVLVIDSATEEPGVSQPRIDIELGANASARFIEYHLSTGSQPHYANSVVNLSIDAGACVDYVRIQERDRDHSQTGRLSARLGRDARLHHSAFDLGGKLVRNDLHIDILEPGAEALFDGLYIAGDDQHIDNHTRVDHRVGPAISRQEYRGILKGKARCVWNGKAIVHDGADGTDAEQANHNLLLSKNAEIDAKPELEIYAEDVKCSHGTTVGQLDETALFYLRTRGLDEQHATRVMTHAFAAEVVNRAPVAELRERISATIEARLGDLAEGG
jgi:Fe-S cluster assembly protein SufD